MRKSLLFVAGAGLLALPLGLLGNVADARALANNVNDLITAGGDVVDVTLDAAITEDIVVPNGKTLNLNLAGFNVTAQTCHAITVELGGTLNLTGTGEVKPGNQSGCTALYNNGTANLKGGKLMRDDTTPSYYVILNHGNLKVEAPTEISSTRDNSSLVDNGYYNYTDTNPILGYVVGTNQAAPEMTVDGGTFVGGMNTIKNDDGAKLTINGGDFTNTKQVPIHNNNIAVINGGTFHAPTGDDKTIIFNRELPGGQNAGELTINGGIFLDADYLVEGHTTDAPGKVLITGGDFKGIHVNIVNDQGGRPGTESEIVKVTGGTFDPTLSHLKEVVDGDEFVINADGQVTKKPEAVVPAEGEDGKGDGEEATEKAPATGVAAKETSARDGFSLVTISLVSLVAGVAVLFAKYCRNGVKFNTRKLSK